MPARPKSLRISVLSLAALALGRVKTLADRLTGRGLPSLPNYTCLEDSLYIGGRCTQPPPGKLAVLNLTPTADVFRAEIITVRPLHPGVLPSVEWLRDCVLFIVTHRRAGYRVFVHCDAGIDRSALVVTAYFMWRDRLTRAAALELLQRKRPAVRPSPPFLDLLDRWHHALSVAPPDMNR
jgi:hypothetical protein